MQKMVLSPLLLLASIICLLRRFIGEIFSK
jgi:hypothetical protein